MEKWCILFEEIQIGCKLAGLTHLKGRLFTSNAFIEFSTMMNFEYVHNQTNSNDYWIEAIINNSYTLYLASGYVPYDEPRVCMTVPVAIRKHHFWYHKENR